MEGLEPQPRPESAPDPTRITDGQPNQVDQRIAGWFG
jgi:hypothetical protein